MLVRRKFLGDSSVLRCFECATECLDPQTDDARLAEIYDTSYFDHWGVEWDKTLEPMMRKKFEWLLDLYPLSSGSRLLDLGCGTGFLLKVAAERRLEPYGIDVNTFGIEQARQTVPEAQVHCGTLADAPFDGLPFDSIFMIDMIEHVRDPVKELTLAVERLNTGGILVISTPRIDHFHRRWMRWSWWHYKQEHLTYFSLAGLKTLMERSGLRVVRTRSTVKTVTLAYMFRNLQAYPHPVLTPLSNIAYRLLPFLRDVRVGLWLGEMAIVGRKIE